ncbi:MAG: PHP domain-containing protein [Gemmatimonadaceae bacterium]|nr:PHP domain-containing protein [Gemmatimonadaceae bacterium]
MTAPTGESLPPVTRFVDLHMHSTASDGARAPEEVAAAAAAAGLSASALTDHDTIGGVATARAAGERLGLRVITGVELSAFEGDREIHLLGLHLDRPERIEGAMEEFRATRVTRAREMVGKLNALGIPVTFDAVLAAAGPGAVGRPHVARAVVDGGWALDSRAGGLAIVAHPGPDFTRTRVERAVALGLDGLEVWHPSHSGDEVRRLRALVDHFHLVASGGSDWHGAAEGPRVIGVMKVPVAVLEKQEARLAERRSAPAAEGA